MTYVIKTMDGAILPITDQENEAIVRTINSGQSKLIIVGRQSFNPASISCIITEEVYWSAQDEQLASKGRFQCRYGRIHRLGDVCDCYPPANEITPEEKKQAEEVAKTARNLILEREDLNPNQLNNGNRMLN